jgi:GNAT superfamily N-acetyltransferase
MGVLQDPPPVYAPGGKTLLVDDFAVVEGAEGDTAASALLDAVISEARARGAVQMIVVAAARDARATRWLEEKKLRVASQWWTRTLTH